MYSVEKNMFGNMVLEVLVQKYADELERCAETSDCSEMHLKKMSDILDCNTCEYRIWGKRFKKIWVAALIAAALLLLGCAAYICREEIKGFILELHEEFVRVQFPDAKGEGVPKSIQEEYTLGYVPEEFMHSRKILLESTNFQEWSNEAGDTILFVQEVFDEDGIDVDAERGTAVIFEHGEYSIYLKTVETEKIYLWSEGRYALVLSMPVYISDEEAIGIIDNIVR